jgi:hypothetical protein
MERAMRSEAKEDKPVLAWTLAAGFFLLAVGIRLVPRLLGPNTYWPWNLTAVGALGLFAGARLRSRAAFLVPVAAMLVSDLLMWKLLAEEGFPAFGRLTPFRYGCFLLYAVIGRFLSDRTSPLWVGGGSLAGSILFFVLTNFGVWVFGDGTHYSKDLAGLAFCYEQAIPFFQNTLAGDLGFTVLFFGLYAVLLPLSERQKASQPV